MSDKRITLALPTDVLAAPLPEHMDPVKVELHASHLTPERFREICRERGFEFDYGHVAIVACGSGPTGPLMHAEWREAGIKYVLNGPVDTASADRFPVASIAVEGV